VTEKDPNAIDLDARIREAERQIPPYHPPGAIAPIPFEEVMSWVPFLQEELLQEDLLLDAAPAPFGNLGGRPRQYTRDDLLAEFERVRNVVGKDPTWADIDRHGRIGRATFQSRIGNMPQVREAHREWAATQPPGRNSAPAVLACELAPAASPPMHHDPGASDGPDATPTSEQSRAPVRPAHPRARALAALRRRRSRHRPPAALPGDPPSTCR
jgi:hypothetical protein